MEESVQTISISELLQCSRPVTGTYSLKTVPNLARNTENPKSVSPSRTKRKLGQSNENPISSTVSQLESNPRTLYSYKFPTLLIGKIELHVRSDSTSSCSKYNCLSFSDGSGSVCCEILGFDAKIVGKRIHVLAWNFIPFKCYREGFLEIIRWEIAEPANGVERDDEVDNALLILAPSPKKEWLGSACSRICGILESISPVLVVPCTVEGRNSEISLGRDFTENGNLTGFLAKIMVCECTVCKGDVPISSLSDWRNCHSFVRCVSVYFCQSASSWHPILRKVLGNVVIITGFKKKMVCIGEGESHRMLVTTEKAALYLSQLPSKIFSRGNMVISGKGEAGVYTGIVTGVYMQGMAVELDQKVWVLITDRRLTQPHFLRVGALISLSYVHFVSPKFSWIKVLLLGVCFKSNIDVKSFSPLETQCHFRSLTGSSLGRLIESLTFSARFWVLLTVACFRKKFSGILSDKEILGSKHNEGLVHAFASSCLPSCAFPPRHGVFMEFCNHDLCGSYDGQNFGSLMLAVPMCNFISKSEALWINLLSQVQMDTTGKKNHIRRIISSKDLGITLMGILQINPSGRLQLVDATGSIDVVVPDLLSDGYINKIYEVKDYKLVLEGLPMQVGSLGMLKNEALSCRSIFCGVTPKRMVNQLSIYVHFYLTYAICLKVPLRLPSCPNGRDNMKGCVNGKFHLLMIKHKFPAIQSEPTLSAEALIMPYYLFLAGKDGNTQLAEVGRRKLETHLGYVQRKSYTEGAESKRIKIVHASTKSLQFVSAAELREFGKGWNEIPKDFCCSLWECINEQKDCNACTHPEIPCSVTVRSINNDKSIIPGILFYTRHDLLSHVIHKPSVEKVMLEFKYGTFNNYQLLHIGGFYLMRCGKEEHLCNLRGHNDGSGRVSISSQTLIWSLSFSSDEFLHQIEVSPGHVSDVSSVRNDDTLAKLTQSELPFQRSMNQIPGSLTDFTLHITAEAEELMKYNKEILRDFSIQPVAELADAVSISTHIQAVRASPLQPLGTDNLECRFPEGNLVSVFGEIMKIHSVQRNLINATTHSSCESIGGIYGRVFLKVPGDICIHLCEDGHMVTIRGTLSGDSYPIGFGPGANATFHRVLLTVNSSRWRELLLTPVSFIAINSVKETDCHYTDGNFLSHSISDGLSEEVVDMVSSGLISHLFQCLENQPIRLRCKVEAILILVLERQTSNIEEAKTSEETMTPITSIPLAGFILDDGSSPCCCWADAERAARLLRLQESAVTVCNSSCMSLKIMGTNKTPDTTCYRLEKMLKEHQRITVRNYGAILDPSCIDFRFSVNSNKIFSISDMNLLKFIILNASCGSILSVVGTIMDSNAIGLLENELEEIQVPLQSMQNIWASEVGCINPLAEARSIIQDLVSGSNC